MPPAGRAPSRTSWRDVDGGDRAGGTLGGSTYPRLIARPAASRYDAPAAHDPARRRPSLEELVARAKRTDRTDARRRYRAEQAALAPDDAGATDDPTTASAPGSGSKAAPSAASAQPGPRPSIRAAFSGAIRPLDLRGDLRAAPRVLTHWAVLAAIAISIVSSIAFVVSTNELFQSVDWTATDPLAGKQFSTVGRISFLGVQLFVLAPPFAGAFLIGFTAKRASWLGGLAFGIVATVCFTGILQ